MLKIDLKHIEEIQSCTRKEDLYPLIQNAIVLEHATIPPYLTAMFSIKEGENQEIERLIRSIVIQEMSHMTIAANLLVAMGGSPQINKKGFIPVYPGPLPMSIGGDDFEVPIKSLSKSLIYDVFMTIEEPESPIEPQSLSEEMPTFATIGQFYEAVKEKIRDLGNDIFLNNPDQQVLSWFDANHVFPIVDVDSACKGIDVIILEGEGTSTDPFEAPGEPAHYYKFAEIYYGRRIIKTQTGYDYLGQVIPFHQAGVQPMIPNPSIEDYPVGSTVRILMERYAYSYSSLLNSLHDAFNGDPQRINTAIGLMYELKLQAVDLMSTEISPGVTAGPAYVYRSVQGAVSTTAYAI